MKKYQGPAKPIRTDRELITDPVLFVIFAVLFAWLMFSILVLGW
jgi:hypothetical protein